MNRIRGLPAVLSVAAGALLVLAFSRSSSDVSTARGASAESRPCEQLRVAYEKTLEPLSQTVDEGNADPALVADLVSATQFAMTAYAGCLTASGNRELAERFVVPPPFRGDLRFPPPRGTPFLTPPGPPPGRPPFATPPRGRPDFTPPGPPITPPGPPFTPPGRNRTPSTTATPTATPTPH